MRTITANSNNITSMQVTKSVNDKLERISLLQNGKSKAAIVEELALLLTTLHNFYTARTPENEVIKDLHDLFKNAAEHIPKHGLDDERMITIAIRKIHSNKVRATRLMYNLSNSQVFEILIPYYMNVRVFHGDEVGLYRTVADLTCFDRDEIDNMNVLINRWEQLAVVKHMQRILNELDVDVDWHKPMLDAALQIGVNPDAEDVTIVKQGEDYDFS